MNYKHNVTNKANRGEFKLEYKFGQGTHIVEYIAFTVLFLIALSDLSKINDMINKGVDIHIGHYVIVVLGGWALYYVFSLLINMVSIEMKNDELVITNGPIPVFMNKKKSLKDIKSFRTIMKEKKSGSRRETFDTYILYSINEEGEKTRLINPIKDEGNGRYIEMSLNRWLNRKK